MFSAALFAVIKVWKPPECPAADEWVKRLWFLYTTKCYSAIKKDETSPFATAQMDPEGDIMLSEISQRRTNTR